MDDGIIRTQQEVQGALNGAAPFLQARDSEFRSIACRLSKKGLTVVAGINVDTEDPLFQTACRVMEAYRNIAPLSKSDLKIALQQISRLEGDEEKEAIKVLARRLNVESVRVLRGIYNDTEDEDCWTAHSVLIVYQSLMGKGLTAEQNILKVLGPAKVAGDTYKAFVQNIARRVSEEGFTLVTEIFDQGTESWEIASEVMKEYGLLLKSEADVRTVLGQAKYLNDRDYDKGVLPRLNYKALAFVWAIYGKTDDEHCQTAARVLGV